MRKVVSRKIELQKRGNHLQKARLVRNNRITIVLNDKEKEALDSYCKKYKVVNKAKFIRETLFSHIMERFLADYPTLFEQKTLETLVVKEPQQSSLF